MKIIVKNNTGGNIFLRYKKLGQSQIEIELVDSLCTAIALRGRGSAVTIQAGRVHAVLIDLVEQS